MMINILPWWIFIETNNYKNYPIVFIFLLVFHSHSFGQLSTSDFSNVDTSEINAAANSHINKDSIYPFLFEEEVEEPVSAIGYMRGGELKAFSSSFISNAFTGKFAGLYTKQISGEPGNDGANLYLRGQTPLILVDGVPRDLLSINPEQIESVIILKDALSTAMLGMQGMNGAILITTKKGSSNRGLALNFNAQTGISSPIKIPQALSADEYAALYNEGLINDGKEPLYSSEDINDYKSGNSIEHPNIDWYDEILNKHSYFQRYTLNAEGAGKSFDYFVSLDYLNQNGMLKESSENPYNTNVINKRYILRSNVSTVLTDRLTMQLNVLGQIRDRNEPGNGTSNIFSSLRNTPSNAYPIFNPDGSLGGNINFNNNIYGQVMQSGYTSDSKTEGFVDLCLRRDMRDLIEGLWVKSKISYDVSINQLIDRSKNFETFQMKLNPVSGDTTYQRYGEKTDQLNSSTVDKRFHQIYFEAASGYSNRWANNGLDVLLVYNQSSFVMDSELPNEYKTVSSRVQYNHSNKYILEGVLSYSGNNRYQEGSRFGIFPAIGGAWKINEEEFMKNSDFFDELKLRATWGLVGNAVADYFGYIERYGGATGYYFGTAASSQSGRNLKRPETINTWEKAHKFNFGFDLSFIDDKAKISIDYYRDHYRNLVISRINNIGTLGWGDYIPRNIGRNFYSGAEITAGWSSAGSEAFRPFEYFVYANLSLSDSKVLFNDEPDYPYSWMQRVGHPVGQPYGYVANGFVDTSGEGVIVEGYNPVPGDLQYKDLNGDGIINQYDMKPIGNANPLLFYGLNFGMGWKGLGISLLVQGVGNSNLVLTGQNQWAFQNDGKGQAWEHNLNRWTSDNPLAELPRVSVGTNVNNDVLSSFWVKSGDYVRLKDLQISWTVPRTSILAVNLSQIKFFIQGYNLLTFSKYKETDIETMANIYPNQRNLLLGINVNF